MKLAQPLVLSTDVWTPGPFDQISILRRNKFGGFPRPPRHRNAMCPKMSQRLGVSRQTSPYLSSTSKHAKVHKASLKTTFTPLNNTNPSPTRHTHQDHSLPSHNSPSHTNNTTHHPLTKMSLPQPPPQPPPSLSSLPEELSALIILALPIPALAALSQTNRKFRRLCNWKLEAPRREWFKRIVTCPISDLWPDPYEMNRRI